MIYKINGNLTFSIFGKTVIKKADLHSDFRIPSIVTRFSLWEAIIHFSIDAGWQTFYINEEARERIRNIYKDDIDRVCEIMKEYKKRSVTV